MEKERVVLFKENDKSYRDLFERQYEPNFIPVLDHTLSNIELLADILSRGPRDLNGLILTSQRSVEALNRAYGMCRLNNKTHEAWNALPVYIVGPKTADALAQSPLFQSHTSDWTVAPRASELIQPLLNSSHYLFLAGDKRHDLIPEALSEAHIPFHEIQTYATCPHPALATHLNLLVNNKPGWLVFFSPSGIQFILSIAPKIKDQLFSGAYKIATIGPTTADFIIHELGFKVDVVPDKPDVEHLIHAMIQIDHLKS
ncbi:Uroporphyrinogen-III synthase [Choanephora cucurbitarum]|uniref:Uroporphyrinogen-III synthase n=1 Tax=Choanephora cucurbitarum TaxID=101091 RepID=A0A1C7N7F3_9FUNG|nr:Uroporphyrinogen-III synthase [Choanephora cucurbitarum]